MVDGVSIFPIGYQTRTIRIGIIIGSCSFASQCAWRVNSRSQNGRNVVSANINNGWRRWSGCIGQTLHDAGSIGRNHGGSGVVDGVSVCPITFVATIIRVSVSVDSGAFTS